MLTLQTLKLYEKIESYFHKIYNHIINIYTYVCVYILYMHTHTHNEI